VRWRIEYICRPTKEYGVLAGDAHKRWLSGRLSCGLLEVWCIKEITVNARVPPGDLGTVRATVDHDLNATSHSSNVSHEHLATIDITKVPNDDMMAAVVAFRTHSTAAPPLPQPKTLDSLVEVCSLPAPLAHSASAVPLVPIDWAKRCLE
jgi:hypothetical protein